jgi:hypothetical protein
LIEWKLILVPILPAAVVWQLAIKRTVLWVLVLLILAMQFLVLAMLWALVVVMAQKVGMVARVEMAARKSGCYLTTERELLHGRHIYNIYVWEFTFLLLTTVMFLKFL